MSRLSGAVPAGSRVRVLRALSGSVALIVTGAIALVLLGDALVRAGILEMLRLAPWVLLAVWGVYVLIYASHIAFDARGATVQNYLRVTRLSWHDVQDLSLRWQVVFTLSDGTAVTAYGGPVVGRPGRAGRRDGDRGRRREEDERRAVPAALREFGELRDAWHQAESEVPSAGASRARAVRSWDVPALIALAVIVIGAVIASLSTGGL